MRKWVAVAMVPILAGCSLLAGGKGEFTAEGRTYKAEKLLCSRDKGVIGISALAGAAAFDVEMSDSPNPEVSSVRMGAQTHDAFLDLAEGGQATVTRAGDSFELTGKVAHTKESRNAPPGTLEDFTATLTCREFKTL